MQNLTRWLIASMLKQIAADWTSQQPSITLQFISQDRLTTTSPENNPRNSQASWAELRLDGPYINEAANSEVQVTVFANILVKIRQDSSANIYTPATLAGAGFECLRKDVQIFKLGGQPEDDGSFLGCLPTYLPISTNQHGQVENQGKHEAISIETGYRGFISLI